MQQIYRRSPMSKWDFNKIALQPYWNHTSACVFSCKFAAYFQNTFSSGRLLLSIQNISKPLFQLTRTSIKITEFYDSTKFPQNVSSKDGAWRKFLDIGSNGTSSKKWLVQKREFSYTFFQLISYNNVLDTKQIYFVPTFL